MWNSFKIAFSMYSKIPMPKTDWNKENMKYALCFFPLVGLAIGIIFYLWSLLAKFLALGNIFTIESLVSCDIFLISKSPLIYL